ncbi:MAG: branched-chain amino acid ABC transporter permease [Anaerolineae bacterium]|jgi:branched-chain amino acid transport system permease protein|nr:branched-chain amino acid ABC transporter permease [Anaerolineae bacterium]MDH7474601.1 branched-chain amino acid ABC transporter permease [Anaerolineae bacterium]
MGRKQVIFIALLIAILVLLPVVVKKDNIINLALLVLLYICLASSWNILGGYTGQTNLGHAAFFGLGALSTRFLWMSGWSLLPSVLAGGLLAVAFALLIGIPAFRLRGVYFAIGTLALAQILYITVGNVFSDISSLRPQDLATYQLVPRYYFFLVLALLITGTTYLLVNSKLGLGMMAVREEEEAAESLGVSALKHKLLALSISAFFAGLSGGAFAYYHVGYYPRFPFSPEWTFDSMMMVYIGGAGTIIGPIIGALFFVVVRELLALKLVELHLIVFGILFILVVLFLPGGFVEAWKKMQAAFARRSKERGVKVSFQTTDD